MTSLSGEEKEHIFGQTGDTDTTMILVLAIDSSDPTRTFTAYNADKSVSTDYTIDCSDCTFA